MAKIRNENFITIQGWMVNELKLKNNELIIYALIYGFSQDNEQSFSGSLQYIADWTNSTKQGVSKAIKRLIEKGLIEKKDIMINGVKFCEYRATKFNGGMQQSCTNNILDNIDNNILDNIDNINTADKEKPVKEKPVKHKYGEFDHVLLTDHERDKLFNDYGEAETLGAIKFLDEYIEEKGYKSKSHNLAMRRWVFDALKKKENNKPQGRAYGMTPIDWGNM